VLGPCEGIVIEKYTFLTKRGGGQGGGKNKSAICRWFDSMRAEGGNAQLNRVGKKGLARIHRGNEGGEGDLRKPRIASLIVWKGKKQCRRKWKRN